jgi:hypothetical protein
MLMDENHRKLKNPKIVTKNIVLGYIFIIHIYDEVLSKIYENCVKYS